MTFLQHSVTVSKDEFSSLTTSIIVQPPPPPPQKRTSLRTCACIHTCVCMCLHVCVCKNTHSIHNVKSKQHPINYSCDKSETEQGPEHSCSINKGVNLCSKYASTTTKTSHLPYLSPGMHVNSRYINSTRV